MQQMELPKCPPLAESNKFLVFGGKSGWIGKKVVKMLVDHNYNVRCAVSRLEYRRDIEAEIDEYKPTHILNIAGVTGKPNVSWCDANKEQTVRANVIGTLNLIDIAHQKNIHVTNMATGCIYSYNGAFEQTEHGEWKVSDNFSESDDPNFDGSWYSRTKAYVDRILFNSYPDVLTLRLRMPISDDLSLKCFTTKIKFYGKYRKVVNIPNSMSVLWDLLPLMLGMADKKYCGLINFTNPGVISHNQVLEYYKDIVDSSLTYNNFSLEEHDKLLKVPRSNNQLSTKKLQAAAEELGLSLPDIHTAVKNCFYRLKKNMNPSMVGIAGKKILLTGAAGFTGSQMMFDYMDKYSTHPDFKLVVVDRFSYNACRPAFKRFENHPKFVCVRSDIVDTNKMLEIMKKHEIQIIHHLAAETHVDHSFKCSQNFTQSNVMGTHSLLEAARVYGGVERFLHISTDEVYGPSEFEERGKKEDHSLLAPTNPYSATKAAAEHICWSYFHSYHIPIVMTRGSNIYGPRQFPDKVIPKFIMQLQNNLPVTIHDDHGSGQMLRSFMHVQDVCRAQEIVMARGLPGNVYNITDDFEMTIRELALKLIKTLKPNEDPEKYITYVEGRKFNDKRYHISNQKLKDLGWDPRVNFEEGLMSTIAWYQSNVNYWSSHMTTAALGQDFVPQLMEDEKDAGAKAAQV